MKPNIEGYPNYHVTKDGKVFNIKTGLCLKPIITRTGYIRVDLMSLGVKKTFKVHRLVASVYLPNTKNLPIVMHLDDNKINNNVENLQWGTSSDNNKDAFTKGRRIPPMLGKRGEKCPMYGRTGEKSALYGRKGEKGNNSKLNDLQRIEIQEKYKTGNYSQAKLAKEYGIGQSQIGRIIRNFK